ncbi:aminopeptidase N [Thiomicrospira aerophila AL3]|uniref:Aminopeptidase N n=1 Tax=Thiomicrospira aerophila AL3 TaxID=717772 RepID=W0DQ33_9GAMM|nr:aminopeptidase N [Thiomicrospira aerophila]AHF00690.1 aminopeptidase N [Thiomicrospira aerophila AL3]
MTIQAETKWLKDYQAPVFEVINLDLTFELSPTQTQVTNRMVCQLAPGQPLADMLLDGESLRLISIKLNDQLLNEVEYQLTDTQLRLPKVLFANSSSPYQLEIVTEINPQANTALEGLYLSSGRFCTQCEAEGFRKITYFFDRPDVLTTYQTTVIADKAEYPTLLANGNLVSQTDLSDGRHQAVWQDPHKKPCYLFALVAGSFGCLTDHYTTAEGREVLLEIYTEPRHLAKCRHAMDSLIASMRWDEQRFGLSYDLDRYMIVAVDDFNMGAMENKGLNVFNSKFVLADADSATDVDFEGVEAVIAHEYFHNWTGNRVTCRDWFQLTLKEGLTVFRDQEFTADMLSAPVKRIEDVRRLRSHQFAEDAGPMAHPIQPQSYIEMNNFYTLTVYEKGAEVVRLYQTLLGRDGFRKGMDLYFARHDGQAVTVDDFRLAMADANQQDLTPMQAWYQQAGTPHVKVVADYDASQQAWLLQFSQQNSLAQAKSEVDKTPLLIPIKLAAFDATGQAWSSSFLASAAQDAIAAGQLRLIEGEWVYLLTAFNQTLNVKDAPADLVWSLLRDFSAPVILDYAMPAAARLHLAKFDTDPFNRWEMVQQLVLADLIAQVNQAAATPTADLVVKPSNEVVTLFTSLLTEALAKTAQADVDWAWYGYALNLPDMSYLIEQFNPVPIAAVLQVYPAYQRAIGLALVDLWQQTYQAQAAQLSSDYAYNAQAIGRRLLKNRALQAWLASGNQQALSAAKAQYQTQAHMTDVAASLQGVMQWHEVAAAPLMDDFYQRWQDQPLVLDKWFAWQAGFGQAAGIAGVDALLAHAKFAWTTPNRVRSVLGSFARINLALFHQADGAGYRWLAKQVLHLDAINPQVAARMVVPLIQWRRYQPKQQRLMKQVLEELKGAIQSKDVFEIVSKALVD